MKTRSAATISLFGGLAAAQAIASLHVLLSNLALHHKMTLIARAGYLTVPGPAVLPGLKSFTTAICGGLFFTLSIGAGISLLSLACAWVVRHGPLRSKPMTILFLSLWSGAAVALNWQGLVWMPTLYWLVVPVVVVALYWRLSPEKPDRRAGMTLLVHILVVILLAGVWWTQKTDALFVNIRDHLLLSNKPGIAVNDFYYRYTLYPAEAFRSLDQMLLKTYRLSIIDSGLDRNRLIRRLNRYNYLFIGDHARTDIAISVQADRIRLSGPRQNAVETDLTAFFNHPRKHLHALSERNDAQANFRKATSLGLLFGFPLLLYWSLSALFTAGFSLIFGRGLSSVAGAVGCGLLGLSLILAMPRSIPAPLDAESLADMLASPDTRTTVAGLKQATAQKFDLHRFANLEELSNHPSIAVRYWLARGFSVGSSPQDVAYLMKLMQDPHPNVACQAIYSLGRRKFKQAMPPLLQIVEASDHWYVQLYAYGALRKLGWKQDPSESKP